MSGDRRYFSQNAVSLRTKILHFMVGSYMIITGDFVVGKIFSFSLYFYGGLQKLNYRFVATDAMTSFLNDFCNALGLHVNRLSKRLTIPMSLSSALVEVVIGIGLLFESTQFYAAALGLCTHILILLAVGPLGSNAYQGIWAWNIYCMVTLIIQFMLLPPQSLWEEVFTRLVALEMSVWFSVIFFAICPSLSWFELWHPQLSFQLHSNNFPEIGIRFSTPKLLSGLDISPWVGRTGSLDIFGIAGTHGVAPAFSFKTGTEWSMYLAELSGQAVLFTYKARPAAFTGVRETTRYIVNSRNYQEIK